MATFVAWCAGAAMASATLAVALAAPVPSDARAVAAVFPPWWTVERAYAAASDAGHVLGPGMWRNVLVLRPSEDLASRLSAMGAWIVVDADMLGCSPQEAGT
ncbi:hypothetical protein [Lutibaculum baratangense]|uniref:Uncharacterized protein n=1 Tax=Lutibaculum baratangense AMV1 TaxID=631454 RepID=V4RFQ6_9HYPH|nr:hypothetical protein [Lutibaculum baratangense]ESR24214.1 hypothetical protein N177_2663 [Lutibaculum baratangense AMV1]